MDTNEARLHDWLVHATERLSIAGVDEPAKMARYLAAHALQQDVSWVLAHAEFAFPFAALEPLLQRAEQHEPLAYIRGYAYFDEHMFIVRPGVLIPRPETHHVVEVAARLLGESPSSLDCLDLCCGSGIIGITLALKGPHHWTLSDLSSMAIQVSQLNADRLKADVKIVQGDLVQPFKSDQFDLVCTNPPYVEANAELAPNVRHHEPELALFAGEDGLDIYRRLATELGRVVRIGGRVVMEIGAGQSEAIDTLFCAQGWQLCQAVEDLAGIPRVLVFQLARK